MIHQFPVRVYYEDTDLAGIVYYANYLKFIERGRSEWIREIGVNQIAMKAIGIVFAVRRVEADYFKPAHYDDMLTIETCVEKVTAARLVLRQRVFRDADLLFEALVIIVAIDRGGKPVRLPANIRPN